MMVARQAICRNLAQDPAYNRAQSLLHDIVIGNQAVWMFFAHVRLVNGLGGEIKGFSLG